MIHGTFDASRYRWKEVTGRPGSKYKIQHDYTILGYDRDVATLDMVVRWQGDGGHCPIHRHAATTSIIVLAGEQHLWDVESDGSIGNHRFRRAGDYALTGNDQKPHLERGGDDGGLVYFGARPDFPDALLYEIYDADMNVVARITIDSLVADFNADPVPA
ncbi:hypothetical protein I546_6561 [Mycobacterium kansasii 732]|uniref:Cysteine dioxygenase n=1 Tax=Mycobacterium pseudokansasii TaxID=2341080 RepID=A0A498QQ37_9MYCO|nr:hypothetical protein [Mycobacterium pseudokansasii]EUA00051.1 hypothetical protein I546_6561 [Mycobacterium kansasii 732]VBA49108.1 hypothetical protein LAUMK142_01720 [Mycobacterium pseudokansasii]